MGAAEASGQRGGQASRDVGGLDEEKRRTRPRVGEWQRGLGNAAERGYNFCALPGGVRREDPGPDPGTQ
jgi:hypothetical protein